VTVAATVVDVVLDGVVAEVGPATVGGPSLPHPAITRRATTSAARRVTTRA
jgi:hypothetical protein